MEDYLRRSTIFINKIYRFYPKLCLHDNRLLTNTENDKSLFIWIVFIFYITIFIKLAMILFYFVIYSFAVRLIFYLKSLIKNRSMISLNIFNDVCKYVWIIIKKIYM